MLEHHIAVWKLKDMKIMNCFYNTRTLASYHHFWREIVCWQFGENFLLCFMYKGSGVLKSKQSILHKYGFSYEDTKLCQRNMIGKKYASLSKYIFTLSDNAIGKLRDNSCRGKKPYDLCENSLLYKLIIFVITKCDSLYLCIYL